MTALANPWTFWLPYLAGVLTTIALGRVRKWLRDEEMADIYRQQQWRDGIGAAARGERL